MNFSWFCITLGSVTMYIILIGLFQMDAANRVVPPSICMCARAWDQSVRGQLHCLIGAAWGHATDRFWSSRCLVVSLYIALFTGFSRSMSLNSVSKMLAWRWCGLHQEMIPMFSRTAPAKTSYKYVQWVVSVSAHHWHEQEQEPWTRATRDGRWDGWMGNDKTRWSWLAREK